MTDVFGSERLYVERGHWREQHQKRVRLGKEERRSMYLADVAEFVLQPGESMSVSVAFDVRVVDNVGCERH
jgi:hypothetical protein